LDNYCRFVHNFEKGTLLYTNNPNVTEGDESELVEDLINIISDHIDYSLNVMCNTTTDPTNDLTLTYRTNEEAIELESKLFQEDTEGDPDLAYLFGGVVFPQTFDYQVETRKIPPLEYTLRMTPEYAMKRTDSLFPPFVPDGTIDSRECHIRN
jgi:hypothetical protein